MRLSISNLEQLSGVPVHTIRIWERRYNALEPLRSTGNTRFYNDEHLKRLLNIVSLQQLGYKISQACALEQKEIDAFLEQDLAAVGTNHSGYEFFVSRILTASLAYDELLINNLLDQSITEHGITATYIQVMFPMMQRLGLMWRLDHICPAHEHFIAAIVRQKLMQAISSVPLAEQTGPSWLLYLQEDEGHDIPLLFASFMLRSHGYKVIYLGERVPFGSVEDAYNITQPQNLLLFMIRRRPVKEAETYLKELSASFPKANIFLAGNGRLIGELELETNINWFSTIEEFSVLLKNKNE
ncbi:MAG: MerR family transcriptional regulator [Bacteroidota bacterium]